MLDNMTDIGQRKWHRIFGWVTITHPYNPDGSVLVDSDHKHIQQYVSGKGWIDYIGQGENGIINHIFMNKSELFDEEQKDNEQALLKMLVKVLA